MTYEQACEDAYGDVAAWEAERHGTLQAALNERYRPTPRELSKRPAESYRQLPRLRRLVPLDPLLQP